MLHKGLQQHMRTFVHAVSYTHLVIQYAHVRMRARTHTQNVATTFLCMCIFVLVYYENT
jgi:hypothetical protein